MTMAIEQPTRQTSCAGTKCLRPPSKASARLLTKEAAAGELDAVRRRVTASPLLARLAEPLLEAAAAGHAEVVRFLLEQGADANAASDAQPEYRPLHRAIEQKRSAPPRSDGHVRAVAALLEHGADLTLRGTWCEVTPLVLATMGPAPQFVPVLLPYLSEWDVFTAAALGESAKVALMLKREPALARAVEVNGMTALHYCAASRLGSIDPSAGQRLARTAVTLLDAGADLTAAAGFEGRAPMTATTFAVGNKSVLQALLLYGANPLDALEPALRHGDWEVADALVSAGADLKAARVAGWVGSFARSGLSAHVRWLIERGADVNGRTADGRTALHWAAHRGASAEHVSFLLERGAQINVHDASGDTPLEFARLKGKDRVIQLLEKHGATE